MFDLWELLRQRTNELVGYWDSLSEVAPDDGRATEQFKKMMDAHVEAVRAGLELLRKHPDGVVHLPAAAQPGERERALERALRHALKRYQREMPCSCHDCRRDAGATDGVGTNGGCKHSTLRTLLRAAAPPGEEKR